MKFDVEVKDSGCKHIGLGYRAVGRNDCSISLTDHAKRFRLKRQPLVFVSKDGFNDNVQLYADMTQADRYPFSRGFGGS